MFSSIKIKIVHLIKQKITNSIRSRLNNWLNINAIDKTLQLHSNEIAQQTILIAEITKVLKERTEYHLDIHNRIDNDSQVILIGKYRNRDFVKCYNIRDDSFNDLMRHCVQLEKYAFKGKIDTIPGISACINKKLEEFG